jgi:hypothetical protein
MVRLIIIEDASLVVVSTPTQFVEVTVPDMIITAESSVLAALLEDVAMEDEDDPNYWILLNGGPSITENTLLRAYPWADGANEVDVYKDLDRWGMHVALRIVHKRLSAAMKFRCPGYENVRDVLVRYEYHQGIVDVVAQMLQGHLAKSCPAAFTPTHCVNLLKDHEFVLILCGYNDEDRLADDPYFWAGYIVTRSDAKRSSGAPELVRRMARVARKQGSKYAAACIDMYTEIDFDRAPWTFAVHDIDGEEMSAAQVLNGEDSLVDWTAHLKDDVDLLNWLYAKSDVDNDLNGQSGCVDLVMTPDKVVHVRGSHPDLAKYPSMSARIGTPP